MRSVTGLAAMLLLSCLASAAEPAKVSVYPVSPVVTSRPVETVAVLPGTLVPVRADVPMPMAKPETPPAVKATPAPSPALVPPTVSAVTISSCGACEAAPCGQPFFRGRTIASSCGADVCSTPGRPALFGGLFGSSSCSTCSACESSGPCCPRAHAVLARLKAWLMFRPCDGPRAAMFRCEPYMPRAMTAFPCPAIHLGTCHSAGGCVGSSCGPVGGRGAVANGGLGAVANGELGNGGLGNGALGNGAIANGSQANGAFANGVGLGLNGRLLAGVRRTPQDCTNCEPKLSGAKFDECYYFARAIPKSYGCRTNQTNALGGGCATLMAEVPTMKPERAQEAMPIERASAVMPAPRPAPLPPVRTSAVIPASQVTRPVAVVPTPQPLPLPVARPMPTPAAVTPMPVSAAESKTDYVMVAGWRLPKDQAPQTPPK